MTKLWIIGALALVGGCHRNHDDTASLDARAFTSSERAGYTLAGVRPGQTEPEARQALSSLFKPDRINKGTDIELSASSLLEDGITESDNVDVELSSSKPAEVIGVKRSTYYPEGAKRETLLATFRAKFGALAQDGKDGNSFYAGEGVTSSGTILKRCYSGIDSFPSYPPKECGLMAHITLDGNPTVTTARVVMYDFALKAKLNTLAFQQSNAARQKEADTAHDAASSVNSF